MHKRLNFLGIEIRALHECQINTVLVGLRGTGQLYREDNVHKVRRGMAGRIRAGLSIPNPGAPSSEEIGKP